MEELIARVFAARGYAHERHLLTYSFAEHDALQGFYEGVVEKADELAEVFQGAVGGPLSPFPPVVLQKGDNIAAFIRSEANWIAANRSAVSQGFTAVENKIDELLAVYYQTLDRLRRK